MVLLDDVIERFDLTNQDGDFPAGIDLIDGRFVGAALIHRDFFRPVVVTHGLIKETHGSGLVALGRQQKLDGFPSLVNRPIEIFPGTFHLDVGLIHAPTSTHWTLVLAKHLSSKGRNRTAQRLIDE